MINLDEISTEQLQAELNKRKAAKSKVRVRYEITGTWSGYTANQRRVVHREYTTDKEFADKVKDLGVIVYTDRTTLQLNVRQMQYREKKQKDIKTFSKLIRDCLNHGVNTVAELNKKMGVTS